MKSFFIRPPFSQRGKCRRFALPILCRFLSPSVYVCFPSWIDISPTIIQSCSTSQCSHVSLLPPRFPPATVPPGRLRMFWALVVTLVVNVSMINLTPSHPQHGRLSVSTSKMLKCTSKPNLFKQNTPSPTAILRVQFPVQLLICPC